MPQTLQNCISYTLVQPQKGEKITIKRGQSIDHLDPKTQAYLKRQILVPPSVDDIHGPALRVPIFGEQLEEDVKGEAQVEEYRERSETPAQAGAPAAAKVKVVIEPPAGVAAAATVEDDDDDEDDLDDTDEVNDDGAAAGGDEDDGEAPEAEAAPAPKAKAAGTKKAAGGKARKNA